jgi:lipopolysaccharide export system ATP-binding protein
LKVIETRELVKAYRGRRVVDGVSLRIQEGEVVGLLGPNGAGKTTTFYMVIGMVRPESGTVHFDGRDITELPMYQRALSGIGYLPQETSVFRKLTVRENILSVLENMKLSRAERNRRTEELLGEFNIEQISGTKGYALSGGESRRVEIARALATSPAFLLLDEPFTGIDPIMVTELQKIIFRLKERGMGILITDHNVRDTLEITDRAYIISEGKVLESGLPQEIANSERAREVYLGDRFSMGNQSMEEDELQERLNELKGSMEDILAELKRLGTGDGKTRKVRGKGRS